MAALSFLVALYLRVGGNFDYFEASFVVQATGIYTVIAGLAFYAFQLYSGVWRYASLEDLVAIIKAVSVICLFFHGDVPNFSARTCSPLYIANQLASTDRNVGRAQIRLSTFQRSSRP